MTPRTPRLAAVDLSPAGPAARGSAPPVADPAGVPSPPFGTPAQTSRQAQAPQLPAPDGTRTSSRATPRDQASRDGTREEVPQSPAGGELPSNSLPAGSTATAAAMSEDRGPDSLDAHIRKLLRDLGLRGYHTHDFVSPAAEPGGRYPAATQPNRRTR